MSESKPILKLENIYKSFGDVDVLKDLSLECYEGEFITLLGSSGCGKTTSIRIIAGLENPDKGKVILDGVDVTGFDPNKRDVNTVFQNYALFPHMNVESNIAYSLKLKKKPKEEIVNIVKDVLDLVQLPGFEKRLPSELSGGQRQRIAVARALVNKPKVLLLDEPLGALDLKLRREMQVEIKRLQEQLNIAFVYITHDQEEALNMSDRIAVMRNGVFEQIGSANDIYYKPATTYIAKFVGNSNIIKGCITDVSGNYAEVDIEGILFNVEIPESCKVMKKSDIVYIAVRSENIIIEEKGASDTRGIKAVITEKMFAGGLLRLTTRTEGGQTIIASRHGIDSPLAEGDDVVLGWDNKSAVIVEKSDE